MENISNSVFSLTGSFFICRSDAEESCLFRRVVGFRSIHAPALKSATAPKRSGRGETGNVSLFTFARICLPPKLSENTTCFLTASSPAPE